MNLPPARAGLVVVAALVGGGAAQLIVGSPSLSVASAVAVAIGAMAACGLGVVTHTRRQPTDDEPTDDEPIGARRVDGRRSQVGMAWWEDPTVPPIIATPAEHDRPTRDILSYLPAARIPQCPRCGAFGPSTRACDGRFVFACPRCAHPWDWSRDEPWPAVRLAPRLHS